MKTKKVILFIAIVQLFVFLMPTINAQSGMDFFVQQNKYTTETFFDVDENDWFYESVKSAYNYSIISGTSENTFSPDDNVTLAMAVTLACRINKTYYLGNTDFPQGDPWYSVYEAYAKAAKIIPDNRYDDLTAPATRAEFAKIIAKALPADELNIINTVEDNIIPDVERNTDYYDAVYSLYSAGIITRSDSKGTFNPDSNILRSEVAAIVTRLVNKENRVLFIPDQLEISSISFDTSDLIIYSGESQKLSYNITPIQLNDTLLKWESSDDTVVSVENGSLTALSEGEATISCIADNGITATCTIMVKPEQILVNKVSLNKTNTEMIVGETASLSYKILPENASDKSVSWTTSNPEIATVTDDGIINTHKPGTVIITCCAANNKSQACVIKVANSNLDAIKEIEVEDTYTNSVSLKWKKVKKAKGYKVYVSDDGTNYTLYKNFNQDSAKIRDLKDFTKYFFKVTAYSVTEYGTEYESQPVYIHARTAIRPEIKVYERSKYLTVSYPKQPKNKNEQIVYDAFMVQALISSRGSDYLSWQYSAKLKYASDYMFDIQKLLGPSYLFSKDNKDDPLVVSYFEVQSLISRMSNIRVNNIPYGGGQQITTEYNLGNYNEREILKTFLKCIVDLYD